MAESLKKRIGEIEMSYYSTDSEEHKENMNDYLDDWFYSDEIALEWFETEMEMDEIDEQEQSI